MQDAIEDFVADLANETQGVTLTELKLGGIEVALLHKFAELSAKT